MDWLIEHFLWLKTFHIIAVTAWMAGLFYLPRLFAYHVDVEPNSDTAKLFRTMESRLYTIIMTPAMIFSLASGVILAIVLQTWSSGWMHLKLLSVLLLVVFQFALQHWQQALAAGTCRRSSRFFRLVNEIPTILLIFIVIAVVVKPF